jgi:hypothetical protein
MPHGLRMCVFTSNGGSGHALTHGFAVSGYHVTGSTGTLFLYGIVVGAIAVPGLSLLLAGAHRSLRHLFGRRSASPGDWAARTSAKRPSRPRCPRRGIGSCGITPRKTPGTTGAGSPAGSAARAAAGAVRAAGVHAG